MSRYCKQWTHKGGDRILVCKLPRLDHRYGRRSDFNPTFRWRCWFCCGLRKKYCWSELYSLSLLPRQKWWCLRRVNFCRKTEFSPESYIGYILSALDRIGICCSCLHNCLPRSTLSLLQAHQYTLNLRQSLGHSTTKWQDFWNRCLDAGQRWILNRTWTLINGFKHPEFDHDHAMPEPRHWRCSIRSWCIFLGRKKQGGRQKTWSLIWHPYSHFECSNLERSRGREVDDE